MREKGFKKNNTKLQLVGDEQTFEKGVVT